MRRIQHSRAGMILLSLLVSALASAAEHSPDQHAQHRQAMQSDSVRVATATYAIPDVTLINESGHPVRLQEVLASDRPLTVNFIFSSCTTICPVMTATMLQLQSQLANDSKTPLYVSISIDPDFDTADVMKSYATKYGADWTFLTGSQNDVMLVLQSFDAYRGSKINHFALTLMQSGDATEWTRIEGLTSAQELARIWRQISS